MLTSLDTDSSGLNGCVRHPGTYLSRCIMPGDLLHPGQYLLTVGLQQGTKMGDSRVLRDRSISYHENVIAFDISEVGYHLDIERSGIVTPTLHWDVKSITHQSDELSFLPS